MAYNHNIPKKQPKPKKPQVKIDNERNKQYLDLIHASTSNGLKLFNAKRILGWGDGIFQRRTRDLKDGFTQEVEYVKKDKKFISIAKPITITEDEESIIQEYHSESKSKTIAEQNRAILGV